MPAQSPLRHSALAAAATACLAVCTAAAAAPPAATRAGPAGLHRPSPDWRDQVLYFVVTDRFDDGNPANNDQGAGEYRPGDRTRYQGGDLAGLQRRLAYIQGLGATGVWLTPPVANQWLNPGGQYSGYHGYWTEHFKQVDAHLGTLADYQSLSRALHGRGMVLVQDIVLNHTGDYFWFDQTRDPAQPARGWNANAGTPPVARPRQPPFHLNDPRDPAALKAGIYHWTPDITDYSQRDQELNFQMAGLDDLNTENPAVRRALRDSYGFWVREVGVDAFRVDTAFYVPPALFTDFLHAKDPAAPGLFEVARRTGRQQFHVFGEGFGIDKPFQDEQAKKIDAYMRGPQGQPLMPGMLNFPLYGALGDAFARGRPTAELAHRIAATVKLHQRPHQMANFLDNHDVDRFLQSGNTAGLQQALLAMFTLPGIPVVYYGTEQGFTAPRASMFAAGWGSGGRDHFDAEAPLYRQIARLAQLRREHRTLSRGLPTVLKANTAGPGALVWRMQHQGQTLLVALNTAEQTVLADHVQVLAATKGAKAINTDKAPKGRTLQPLLALDGSAAPLALDAQGQVHLQLPPRSGQVWRVVDAPTAAAASATRGPVAVTVAPAAPPTLAPLPTATVAGDFQVQGTAQPGQALQLVVNGDLTRATRVVAGPDGRWQGTVDTAALVDPGVQHSLLVWAATGPEAAVHRPAQASAGQTFRVQRAWALAAEASDPAGDDHGPDGRYAYPTEATYAGQHQMDLRGLRAYTAGGALKVDVQTANITTSWNPANGFDHVAFTVFIELPGQSPDSGSRVMPLQNASLPDGMRWHVRLRAHGWANAMFSAEGATEAAEGRALTPGAALQVDKAGSTVSFTIPAAALAGPDGRPPTSLAGARVYVNTWDYDGGYRTPGAGPQRHTIGVLKADGSAADAASAAGAARVMDDLPPLTLR